MNEFPSHPLITIAAWCVAVVIVYGLSLGPVIGWFAARGRLVPQGVTIFYRPLIQMAKVTPMWDALERYVGNCFMLWRQWLP